MNNALDYSVIDKLGLALPPMGIKYDLFRPKIIPQLDPDIHKSLCELLRYSQEVKEPFYFSRENTETCIGKIILGMERFPPSAESGQIGQRLGVFDDPRCNGRLYSSIRRLRDGTTNFVSFVPYDRLEQVPDLLIFTGTAAQVEPVMRAATYSTGINYSSECTAVMGCSWFMAKPYMTGEINFVIPAFIHGPHGRRLWPEDTVLVSVPYQWIPTVIRNLGEMPLHLAGHRSKDAYYEEFSGILAALDEETKEFNKTQERKR